MKIYRGVEVLFQRY